MKRILSRGINSPSRTLRVPNLYFHSSGPAVRMKGESGGRGVTNAAELPLVAQCLPVCGRWRGGGGGGRAEEVEREKKETSRSARATHNDTMVPAVPSDADVIIRPRPMGALGFATRFRELMCDVLCMCVCIPERGAQLMWMQVTHTCVREGERERLETLYARSSTRDSNAIDLGEIAFP